MQDDTQLPEVGGGGDRRVMQLFGAGVFKGECAIEGRCGFDIGQLLGDAEVEQLHPAFGIHQ